MSDRASRGYSLSSTARLIENSCDIQETRYTAPVSKVREVERHCLMRNRDPDIEKPADAPSPRQRIIACARRHFFARGFRTVTMDELAEDLGMSKKTLYAYFASKSELVKSALLDKFEAADKEMQQITSQASKDFPGALRNMLAAIQSQTDEIQPAFFRDIQRHAPEVYQSLSDRRRRAIRRHFGRLLLAGRKAEMVRRDIPPKLLMDIMLSSLAFIVNPSKLIELRLTPKAAISAIIRVILEGVITAKSK